LHFETYAMNFQGTILGPGTKGLIPFLYSCRGIHLQVSVAQVRQLLLTIGITAASRFCLVRDRLRRRVSWDGRMETAGSGVSRHKIPSGRNVLDAVLVKPESTAAQGCVLICHGIGETVELWHVVQQLLAASGVASLVFDYTGYGHSSGFFTANQAEQDAVAAFHCLERLAAPLPVAVFGMSLGSGIAGAIINKVPAHRLVLCGAFTSLRKAAVSVGIPHAFECGVPPIWETEDALRSCRVPVLIVHGEKDQLFPVRMARELAASCASSCELVIVPKVSHADPFYHPQSSYWGSIVARFLLQSEA
jgi:pimeloyl-ACP methyl ester carboxylesterase